MSFAPTMQFISVLRAIPAKTLTFATIALFAAGSAIAQTNASGVIFGTSQSGGDIFVTSVSTGAVRSATVEANGRYQVTALPPGDYDVELKQNGNTVARRSNVPVTVGTGSEVNFTGEAQAQELDAISVTARSGQYDIDVSATDTRTVFTARNLEKMTVGRNIEDIALLAPGVVRGDSRYNTDKGQPSASFGGAGANENAFYINGYGVTDPVRGLGSSSLPFGGISQYQLLTGGYGAEFGRATGGVVNIVTKSGTNQWIAGANVSWSPDSLRANERDIRYPNNGTADDGRLWRQTSLRERDELQYGAYVGGPLVKDNLFIYAAAEIANNSVVGPRSFGNTSGSATTGGQAGWHDREIDIPRYLIKTDWNIAAGHTAELTVISDVTKETRQEYRFNYVTPPISEVGANTGGREFEDGGELYIGKYTGALTDNLVLTALYGEQKNNHFDDPIGYDPSITPVRDDRPGGTQNFGTLTTLADPTAYDSSEGYRIDLEWQAIPGHSIRTGYDVQNLEVKDGTVTAGPGFFWLYDTAPSGTTIPGSGGAVAPASNGGDFVQKVVSASGGTFTTDQYAYFVEDRWQVTDNLMLSLGLRNENFENFNSDKVLFLDQTDQWAPRIGATWDVNGDGSLRAFANVGRYHLAIPLNLAFRQVGGSTNTSEYFSYTSIDPATGEPQGTAYLVGNSAPFSNNQEYGQARDPDLSAAKGLEPYFQDEFALGVESKLSALGITGPMSDLVGGARFIYRTLESQIDDNCDPRPAYNWAIQNGYESGVDNEDILGHAAAPVSNGLDDGAEFFGAQLAQCRIINPGEDNTLVLADELGNKVLANISAAEWGLPKLRRVYKGLDFFLEHTFRDNWYGKIDYTLSRSEGNAEGQLLSDLGQQDVSVTLNWDHPELMVGNDGRLPNDRTHQIKAFGYYQFSTEWRTSLTLSAASGRPKSESGVFGGTPLLDIEPSAVGTCASQCFYDTYVDYGGTFYRYVDGNLRERGSAGRLPWTVLFDLGTSYSPNILKNQFTVAVDVFNILNSQKEQARVEFQETNAPGVTYHSANRPIAYNAPRSVRISMRYDWGL